ncbi:MAG: hypothetical protein ACRC33_28250, partial [Gemmataceae bacterium]
GRVNLSTAGNVMGAASAHAGSAGWGPWEVNPTKLSLVPGLATEWARLILGNGTIDGKYGPVPRLPTGAGLAGGTMLRDTFPVDLNGVNDPGMPSPGNPTARYTFPLGATAQRLFPGYDMNGYGQAIPKETTASGLGGPNTHAQGYNAMAATPGNRLFGVNDLKALLRRYNSDGGSIPSDVMDLLTANLNGSGLGDAAARYRRSMVTTMSFDLDRAGGPPLVFNPTGAAYSLTSSGYPTTAAAATAENPTNRTSSTPGTGSDYDTATWRSNLPSLKINVGRQLTPYPPPSDPATLQYNTADTAVYGVMDRYRKAVRDRESLASELYERLTKVTVAPTSVGAETSTEFKTHRWLAQLAANIVDYIDVDDHPTPFNWYTENAGMPGEKKHWVFGTEMPRLVINEYYAQLDNDRADLDAGPTKQMTKYLVNVYAELYNTATAEVVTRDPAQGAAFLQHATGKPIYRLRLCKKPNANIRDSATGATDAPATDEVFSDWGTDVVKVLPAATPGAYTGPDRGNQPFFGVGSDFGVGTDNGYLGGALPKLMAAEQKMGDQMTVTTPKMKLTNIPVETAAGTDPEPLVRTTAPSLVLERLANVSLPEQSDPAGALYNPYITVDYVHSLEVEDGREFDFGAAKVPPTVDARKSVGRVHPFAAADTTDNAPSRTTTLWQPADPMPPIMATDKLPQHTLFRHNAQDEMTAPTAESPTETIKVPYDVLYHPNRIPPSVGDLLHVSGWKPHELTQQFMTGTFAAAQRFQHRARWSDARTRLARMLDHMTVTPLAAGVALNGRVPGRLNLNEAWEESVFLAYANATPGNQFTETQARAVWTAMKARRSPSGSPAGTDEPFLSLSTGYSTGHLSYNGSPNTLGPQNTILRPSNAAAADTTSDDTEARLLEPADYQPAEFPDLTAAQAAVNAHPMRRFELMQKLVGNTTTRSNVFGVWTTVGFFRVTDETT